MPLPRLWHLLVRVTRRFNGAGFFQGEKVMDEKRQFVVVTTDKEKRGVFGGFLKSKKYDSQQGTYNVILEDAHMAVSWKSRGWPDITLR